MSPDSLVTIVTGVLQAGGLSVFVLLLFRGISARLSSLEKVIETQKKAIESIEVRANEAEKIAALYKSMVNELPDLLHKQKELTSGIKDDIIHSQESLLQSKDEELMKLSSESLMRLNALEVVQKMFEEKTNIALNLEIGDCSIGWCAMNTKEIVDIGVRCFDEKEG